MGKGGSKKTDIRKDPRFRELVCAPGPSKISRARIRKAVLAAVKARTGQSRVREK